MQWRKTEIVLAAVLMAASLYQSTRAEAMLRITEIWPGGLPGADATSDWFEVTNLGDTPATNLDGNLFYDDNSDDPAASDVMMGIDTIAPGESVIYIVGWENAYNNVSADAVAAFVNMWEPLGALQIGIVDFGGGLGTEGDAVNLFDGNTAEARTIDRAAYVGPTGEPSFIAEADGTWAGRIASVGVLGARLGNLPADDLEAGPPVGSPGIVPEPGSFALLSIGLCAGLGALRRGRARVPVHPPRGRTESLPAASCRRGSTTLTSIRWLAPIALIASLLPLSVRAESNLRITEIWPGALPGTEFTSDWFEVTNFGDEAATGLNGNLYFDDRSDDPLQSDPMVGIDTIAAGESVIYLTTWEDGFNNHLEDAIAAFVAMWQPSPDLQVGSVTLGSGFGGEGDAANIFWGNTADALLIDHVEYPGPSMLVESFVSNADGTWVPILAQVGVLGAYAGFHPADNLSPDPAVGSPGIVPEPASLSLVSGVILAIALSRARRLSDRQNLCRPCR